MESDAAEVTVGTRARIRLGARLPYSIIWDVTYAVVERPRFIEMEAVIVFSDRFPMRGPIRCTLTEGPDGVEVVNEQIVYAARRLPRPLRALAQRAFASDYDWSFEHGGRGLQKAVDEVVAARARDDAAA